jgi:hypothetical protein
VPGKRGANRVRIVFDHLIEHDDRGAWFRERVEQPARTSAGLGEIRRAVPRGTAR